MKLASEMPQEYQQVRDAFFSMFHTPCFVLPAERRRCLNAGMVDNMPFDLGMEAAMAEMEMTMFSVVEDALQASKLAPSEVRGDHSKIMPCQNVQCSAAKLTL